MAIDAVTSNNINSLNSTQNSTLEKIASGLKVNSAANDSSSLLIADNLDLQRSTLGQSLSNINSGVAMSTIAQDGLSQQQDILENINQLSLEALNGTTSDEGKAAITQQISNYTDQFEQIATSTTYNGQQLLTGTTQDLSIVTDDNSTIQMSSVETNDITESLRLASGDFEQLLATTQDAMDSISNMQTQFATTSTSLESAGREALSSQTNLAQANSTLTDVDYGTAVSDFSKNNIMSQIGMLASTQANAVQARNVALLS